ncbi:LexA family protein [Geomobilimonas luticola]|uniref:LexA family transcriptional regulator n=1 Tax=Geomobilimonas luticola TaxID=1114878 RepID=A0ABS5SFI4_9BACT|nr:XRE family transcriptional regulator [Geomobilimonas luticola]MBT0653960.1 LexA family transcriptional regulator [Geomobilimonas luticola]
MTIHKLQPDSTIGSRIKQVRQALGLTQQMFADSLGIVQGFLSSIERGKKVPSETLIIALCHYFNIDREWLCIGRGEMRRVGGETRMRGEAASIPLLQKISEGFPASIKAEDVVEYIRAPKAGEGCYALICYGNFMSPTILDGDLVLFVTDLEPKNGDVVLLNNLWGDVIMRRYRVSGGETIFSPDNTSYAPFKPEPNTRIVGTVVDVWRKVIF